MISGCSLGILANKSFGGFSGLLQLLRKDSFSGMTVVDEASAIEAAKAAAKDLKLGNAADELTAKKTTTVDDLTYYRLQQNYKGIPVYGCTAVVTADSTGAAENFFSNIVSVEDEIDVSNGLNDAELKEVIAAYRKTSAEQVEILDNEKVLYKTQKPELCHRVWVSVGGTRYAELIVSVRDKKIISEEMPFSPAEICTSADGQTFPGSKNENGEYVLVDTEKNFYCLTAGGESIYDPEQKTWVENSAMLISSSKDTFRANYNDVFGYYSDLQTISEYYKSMFGDNGTEHYALIDDGGYGTSGGMGKSIISEELQELCGGNKEIGLIQIGHGEQRDMSAHFEDKGKIGWFTLAHEYTHMITGNHVGWKSGVDFANEAQAINEAYSDLFGMIISEKNNPDGYMWDNGRADATKPKKDGYPTTVNAETCILGKGSVGGNGVKVDVWHIEGKNRPYTYTNAVVLEHAAYLMSQDCHKNGLTVDEIASLWYQTMLTLPFDCTYTIFRNNMERTAASMGFSEKQQARIGAAFDEIGVTQGGDFSTTFELKTYNKNNELCHTYTLVIEGYEKSGLLNLWKTPYYYKTEIVDTETVQITLPEGAYTVSVSDGPRIYTQEIEVTDNGRSTKLHIFTDFEVNSKKPEQPQPSEQPEQPQQQKDLTFEEAKEIARQYWELSSYETTTSDGTKIAIFGTAQDAVTANGIKYYYFAYKALVNQGSTAHWSLWDEVYVNSKTGACSYEQGTAASNGNGSTARQEATNPGTTKPAGTDPNSISADALKNAILGEWSNAALLNYHAFYADGSCKMLFTDAEPGSFEITSEKTLKIKMPWVTKTYKWNSESIYTSTGWYLDAEGNLIIEGELLTRWE